MPHSPQRTDGIEADGDIDITARYVAGRGIRITGHRRERACPTAPLPPEHFTGRADELNRLVARHLARD